MDKCFLVTLVEFNSKFKEEFGDGTGFVIKIVFQRRPTYATLMKRLPNHGRQLLAQDREGMRFEISLFSKGITYTSTPMFKNDPDGKARYKEGFPHLKNIIGRLSIEELPIVK